MQNLKSRLIALLERFRLPDDQRAVYGDAILSAGSRAELGIIVAEFQDICGDDLDALADGFRAHGNVTEAARIKNEARLAHAPLEALAAGRQGEKE